MGFGALRVINDDVIEAGEGFGMHPHRDMEIVSIVTKGCLLHKDSFGNEGAIRAGEIQYMSAGTGIYHSEFASPDEQTALFQFWIYPNVKGGMPHYEQRSFIDALHPNQWNKLVSSDGSEGSIAIKQDAAIYTANVEANQSLHLTPISPNHGILLLVVEGRMLFKNEVLLARDEIQITSLANEEITALEPLHLLRFDIPLV